MNIQNLLLLFFFLSLPAVDCITEEREIDSSNFRTTHVVRIRKKYLMKGLDKVGHTASLDSLAEKISLLLDAEIELSAGSWHYRKQRIVTNQKNVLCIMDLSVEVSALKGNGTAVNKASVNLLPEELPGFTLALREHPIPFPTNFSQSQKTDSPLCCLLLETKEPPEDFAERLAGAFRKIL